MATWTGAVPVDEAYIHSLTEEIRRMYSRRAAALTKSGLHIVFLRSQDLLLRGRVNVPAPPPILLSN